MSYAFDDEDVQTWTPDQPFPKRIADAILSGEDVSVTYKDFDGNMVSNESKDHVMNISQVSKNQEDIMDILSTEIKHLKSEVKALRQAIILKGMQVN